jgi:hypothetical protein
MRRVMSACEAAKARICPPPGSRPAKPSIAAAPAIIPLRGLRRSWLTIARVFSRSCRRSEALTSARPTSSASRICNDGTTTGSPRPSAAAGGIRPRMEPAMREPTLWAITIPSSSNTTAPTMTIEIGVHKALARELCGMPIATRTK